MQYTPFVNVDENLDICGEWTEIMENNLKINKYNTLYHEKK